MLHELPDVNDTRDTSTFAIICVGNTLHRLVRSDVLRTSVQRSMI